MAKKWYVIQTYSGYENKVKEALQQRIKQHAMEDDVRRDPHPDRDRPGARAGGKSRIRQKTSFPGYIFVEMEMSEEAWHLVKDTPKVTGFIGNQTPARGEAAADRGPAQGHRRGRGQAEAPRHRSRRATRSASSTARSRTSRARSKR